MDNGRNGIRDRIHPGEQRTPRRYQRLGGFQNDGEFDQIVAPYRDQRSGTACAAMARPCANASPLSRNVIESITGGQVERPLRLAKSRHHEPFSLAPIDRKSQIAFLLHCKMFYVLYLGRL